MLDSTFSCDVCNMTDTVYIINKYLRAFYISGSVISAEETAVKSMPALLGHLIEEMTHSLNVE